MKETTYKYEDKIYNLPVMWRVICEGYLRKFCEKQEIDIEWEIQNHCVWVGDDPGDIVCIGDMYCHLSDIRYDVDNNIPEGKFSEWYWTSVDRAELGVRYMNYKSYCKGAPDPCPPEQLERIKLAHKKVQEAKDLLEKELEGYADPEIQKLVEY